MATGAVVRQPDGVPATVATRTHQETRAHFITLAILEN
jgi:hypothetical protein